MRISGLILLAVCISFIAGLEVVHAQGSSWVHRQDFAAPPRVQAVGFSIGGKGYIASGTNGLGDNLLQDLQEYDPGSNSWSFKLDLPVPLRGSAAFVIGNKVYITTGGSPFGLNYQMLVWDQSGNQWSSGPPFPAGKGRMAAIGVPMGTHGYIGTGFDLTERALNDLWEFDSSDQTWTEKASLPGTGRSYATAFPIHDKIYIGLGNNGSAYLKDWWEFTPSTNSWRRMQDLAGEERTGAMGFSVDGKGYVVGGVGYNFKPLHDIWEFDPIQNTWTQLDRFPDTGRGYGVSFVINNTGYIAAGASAGGYLVDLWEGFPNSMVRKSIAKDDPFDNPVVVSPNPFFYRFFVKIRHPYTGMLELTITNMLGEVVFRKSMNKDSEYIVRYYEIDYLPEGLFVFRVKDPTGVIDTKQTVIHKSFDI